MFQLREVTSRSVAGSENDNNDSDNITNNIHDNDNIENNDDDINDNNTDNNDIKNNNNNNDNVNKKTIVVTQLIFRLERQHLETWLEAEKGGNHCLKQRRRAQRRGDHQYQRKTPISTLQIIKLLPNKLILSREIPIQYFISK